MIVVFDTDVLIPMILPASRSAHLYARLLAAGHKVAVSPAILEEVREKLLTDAGLRSRAGSAGGAVGCGQAAG